MHFKLRGCRGRIFPGEEDICVTRARSCRNPRVRSPLWRVQISTRNLCNGGAAAATSHWSGSVVGTAAVYPQSDPAGINNWNCNPKNTEKNLHRTHFLLVRVLTLGLTLSLSPSRTLRRHTTTRRFELHSSYATTGIRWPASRLAVQFSIPASWPSQTPPEGLPLCAK